MTSLPQAFAERIHRQFPEEAEDLIAALDQPARTSIHLHPRKSGEVHYAGESVAWFSRGRILYERPVFTLDPAFHAGAYYPQESSSMFLSHVLHQFYGAARPARVLDLCAAPGGKSILISSFLGEEGVLISNEIVRNRNAILRENLDKWPAENTLVTCSEASAFGELGAYFDCIVIDAPCSGEGMFRKDPDARNEWKADSPAHCAARQQQILQDVLPALKEGGLLIYSTCTFAPDENEEVMKHLASGDAFDMVEIDVKQEWKLHKNPFGWNFLPHRVNGEGFFISAWKKKEESRRSHLEGKPVFSSLPKKQTSKVKEWYEGNASLVVQQDDIYASPLSAEELNALATHLYITRPGVELGRLVREELIPAQALALSFHLSSTQRRIEVSKEDALSYLRGHAILVQADPGWVLLTYQSLALGWVKVLAGRVNNYYPKHWRIRM